MLASLRDLVEHVPRTGLRWLDVALARFVAVHRPAADAATLFVAAWVARAEGLGHSCIDLATIDTDVADAFVDDDGDRRGDRLRSLRRVLPSSLSGWLRSLTASGAVGRADELIEGDAPLVLDGSRLYLRRYWRYERNVASCVTESVRKHADVEDEVPEARIRDTLVRLFPDAGDGATDWQKVACAIAMRHRFAIITGGPGTGKTFVAARILALSFATASDAATWRVALAAPTGKAAARLKRSIDDAFREIAPALAPDVADAMGRIGAATTLHALLGSRFGRRRARRSRSAPLDLDLLVVDEASMINLEMMASLLDALPPQARLVLLGDKDQLASVEAGAVLGDLCRDAARGRYDRETVRYVDAVAGDVIEPGFVDERGPALSQQVVMLRTSRRFDRTIAALASAVDDGDVAGAVALLRDGSQRSARWIADASAKDVVERALAVDAASHRAFVDRIRAGPPSASQSDHDAWIRDVLDAFDTYRVLSATREGPWGAAGINDAIEERLARDGLLEARRTWYVGRPVMVTKNDYGLGVFNGDAGVALPAGPGDDALRVHFGDGSRTIGVARLADVETAFATTVHKSQGSEFDRTLLVLSPDAGRVATRELLYTAVTRARLGLVLMTADEVSLAAAIERRTVRASGLAERLAR